MTTHHLDTMRQYSTERWQTGCACGWCSLIVTDKGKAYRAYDRHAADQRAVQS